jgi:transcriptional regulator with XRE-family HTH domain
LDPAHVGVRLRAFREARQLTQKTLATQVGCTPGLISQIEGGQTCPSLENVLLLAEALAILPMQLLDPPTCPTCGHALEGTLPPADLAALQASTARIYQEQRAAFLLAKAQEQPPA